MCFYFVFVLSLLKRGGVGAGGGGARSRRLGHPQDSCSRQAHLGEAGTTKGGALGELETLLGWLPEISKRIESPNSPGAFHPPISSTFLFLVGPDYTEQRLRRARNQSESKQGNDQLHCIS